MKPLRLSPLDLLARREISRLMTELPDDIRAEADRCAIVLASRYEGEELLGLFEGHSRADPEPQSTEELPRITLFLDAIWDTAGGDPRTFRQEVADTFLHELGHFLGFDEEGVEALGLG